MCACVILAAVWLHKRHFHHHPYTHFTPTNSQTCTCRHPPCLFSISLEQKRPKKERTRRMFSRLLDCSGLSAYIPCVCVCVFLRKTLLEWVTHKRFFRHKPQREKEKRRKEEGICFLSQYSHLIYISLLSLLCVSLPREVEAQKHTLDKIYKSKQIKSTCCWTITGPVTQLSNRQEAMSSSVDRNNSSSQKVNNVTTTTAAAAAVRRRKEWRAEGPEVALHLSVIPGLLRPNCLCNTMLCLWCRPLRRTSTSTRRRWWMPMAI